MNSGNLTPGRTICPLSDDLPPFWQAESLYLRREPGMACTYFWSHAAAVLSNEEAFFNLFSFIWAWKKLSDGIIWLNDVF